MTDTAPSRRQALAAVVLAAGVAAIQWRDGEWTVRGHLARWLRRRLRPIADQERRRNRA